MLAAVPWIGVVVVIYNVAVFAFAQPGSSGALALLQSPLVSVPLMSGVRWSLNVGDGLILLALATLFVELLKAARRRGSSLADHALSTIVLLVCAMQFLLVEKAATSVFFVITMAALIDVVSGFFITIRADRRSMGFSHSVEH
jgi:hypothetical protein